MPRIVVAVGQLCSGASLAANLAAVESLAARAAARGARMLFLPEGTALMCSPAPPPAEPLSGALVASYAAVARRHGLCLSLCVPEAAPPGAPPGAPPYNTHIVLSAAGALLAAYRKVHLFDAPFLGLVESARAAAGAQLVAVDVLGARLGLATCYDLRFPAQFAALARAGADVIAVPSAFTVPTGAAHWEPLLRARAIECQAWVVAAAQAGAHAGGAPRASYGHAMIIDPWGVVTAQLGGEEAPALAVAPCWRVAKALAVAFGPHAAGAPRSNIIFRA
jgi:predicted amidohydrolase